MSLLWNLDGEVLPSILFYPSLSYGSIRVLDTKPSTHWFCLSLHIPAMPVPLNQKLGELGEVSDFFGPWAVSVDMHALQPPGFLA